MKRKNLSLLTLGSVLVLCMLVYASCRKTDSKIEQTTNTGGTLIENKFFTDHRSADPKENALVEFLKRVNSKTPFVETTVKQIGYPRWDKAIKLSNIVTVSKLKTNGTTGVNTANTSVNYDTYYVPFVRDSQNYVNASMIIKASVSDTSIGYLCDWQYLNKTHGSPNVDTTAEKHALFFMMLDNRTLGYKDFTITDPGLFPSLVSRSGKKTIGLTNKTNSASSGQRNSDLVNMEVCYDYYTCGAPESSQCADGCDYLNCISPEGTPTHCALVVSICWVPFGSSGGGGTWTGFGTGSNPGSGGGGGGGYYGNDPGGPIPPSPCQGDPWQASSPNPSLSIAVKVNSGPCNVSSGWVPNPTPQQLVAIGNENGWYWSDPANFSPVEPYDPNRDGPYRSDGFRRNGSPKPYFHGTVQNWINDAGKKIATFTGTNGVSTDFPDAYISDILTPTNRAYTTSDGTIHADNLFTLAGLQHEYGHVLQIAKYGEDYYKNTIMPASLFSIITDIHRHKYFWTEMDANWEAVNFFGFSSPIAQDPTNYPWQ